MALMVYFVLFLAMTGYSSALYCICKDGVGDQALQKAIDYACGAGADCTPISTNGGCFQPNTVKDHCNYAVNSYFQKKGQIQGSCDFAGAAITSPTAPTASSSCVFPTSPGTTGTGTSTTPSTTTPSTTPSTTTPSTTPSTLTPPTSTGTGTGTTTGTPTGTGTGTGTGTSTGTGTGIGTGTGSTTGTGIGTGTGTTTGSPNVFGISPTSSTGTGSFNDNGGVQLKGTFVLLLSLVVASLWLA